MPDNSDGLDIPDFLRRDIQQRSPLNPSTPNVVVPPGTAGHSITSTACNLAASGWSLVPVPLRKKGPRIPDWQHMRINTPELAAENFNSPMNIGGILGPVSGGRVDVDLDCDEACQLADEMLPPTSSVFGRASKPRSHRIYRVDGAAPLLKFGDPLTGDTLVELRGTKANGNPGLQTILPGSVHPCGEVIEWAENGEPALIGYTEVKRSVTALAIRALLARYCPNVTIGEQACAALEDVDPRVKQQVHRWLRDLSNGQSAQPQQPLSDQSSVTDALASGNPPLALTLTETDVAKVWTAVTFIDSRPRDTWRDVGGAIHDIAAWPDDLRRMMWDRWSVERDAGEPKKFEPSGSDTAWASFSRPYTGERITVATIFHLARQAGWDGDTLKPLPDEFRRFLPTTQPDVTSTGDGADGVNAPAATTDHEFEMEVKRLASLAPVQYDRERREAADKLGIRVGTLDKRVAKERGEAGEEERQGTALKLIEPEPWPDAVDGHELMRDLVRAIMRYVSMSQQDALATALWIIHTYVFDVFTCTPRLCISSPQKRCGKTTLLDVIAQLVNRPLSTVGITGPAIFRTVEKFRPTLLFDEGDNLFGRHGKADDARDILAILNSGHRHGGQVLRTVGEDFEPRTFSTHAPAAVAVIGKMPDTLEDRSVHTRLKRKLAGDPVERFRSDRVRDLQLLARRVRRWCEDHRDQLVAIDPEMPPELFNRAADNWRPLLTIADALGLGAAGRWVAIQAVGDTDDALGVMVLADIRSYFQSRGTDVLSSDELVNYLTQLDERPWSELTRGRPITKAKLARLLEPFEIKPEPEPIRFAGGTRGRGYLRRAFDDAFARYLSTKT